MGAARSIAGVISIDLDDSTSTFTIVGDVRIPGLLFIAILFPPNTVQRSSEGG